MHPLQYGFASTARQQLEQFLETLFGCSSGRSQVKVGLAIERFAGLQDILEFVHRFPAARHRPKIALIDDPLHMLFRRGAHPDGERTFEQQRQRLGVRCQSTAGFDDGRRISRQDRLKALAFETPISRLSVKLQNLTDGRAIFALDLAVEFEERHSSLLRKPASQCGLAGAPKSDQCDVGLFGVGDGFQPEVLGEKPARFAEVVVRQTLA